MKSYGHLNPAFPAEYPGAKSYGTKKKVCLIGVPIAIVVLLVIVLGAVLGTRHNGGDKTAPVGSKAIKTVCSDARYPEECSSTLGAAPNADSANLKDLAVYLIQRVQEAVNGSRDSVNTTLLQDPANKALDLCFELLTEAYDQLSASMDGLTSLKLGGLETVDEQLEDFHTWLDASATYHDTCLDELLNYLNPNYPLDTTIQQQPTDPVSTNGEQISKLYSILLHLANKLTGYSSSLADLPISIPKLGFRRLLTSDESSSGSYDSSANPAWVERHGVQRKLLQLDSTKANAVVDVNGSGKYTNLQDAVDDAPDNSKSVYVIYVKAGVYKGQVVISKKKMNIAIVGDGIDVTIFTASESVMGTGSTTFNSATVAVNGAGFLGTKFTVRNTAGPQNHQAVALRVSADFSALYQVKLQGFQDTIYCHSFRQFYKSIVGVGTVDYIFGNAAIVIQDSTLLASTGLLGQQNTYTAQGRTDPGMNTGIVLQGCTFKPDDALSRALDKYRSYLGRPWKAYSRTILVNCYLDSLIDPAGWLPWDGDLNLKTLFYGEFKNKGPGGGVAKRVPWSTQIKDKKQVAQYLVNKFVSAKKWLPATTFPYYYTTTP